MTQRVVITGIGIVSGFGIGKDIFWNSLISDRNAITKVDDWSLPNLDIHPVSRIPVFAVKRYLPKIRPPYPARYSQLAILASLLALEDANINLPDFDSTRVGAVLTTDFGPNETIETYLTDLFLRGPHEVSPLLFSRTVTNVALGDICRYLGIRGSSSMLLGENSICYAYDLLQDDKADIILAGGIDELRDLMVWSYNKLGLLPDSDLAANTVVQPYLPDSAGIVLGEAAAIVVLERLDSAISRGARSYAELLGYSTVRDRSANYILSDRTSQDVLTSMVGAMQEAQLSPQDIKLVFGAASSSPDLGQSELRAVETLWQNMPVQITSIKGAIGETFGSAAAMQLGAAALSLSSGIVPSCGNVHMAPTNSIEIVTGCAVNAQHSHCLCNSIHIGGNNTSVILSVNLEEHTLQ